MYKFPKVIQLYIDYIYIYNSPINHIPCMVTYTCRYYICLHDLYLQTFITLMNYIPYMVGQNQRPGGSQVLYNLVLTIQCLGDLILTYPMVN